MQEAKTSDTEHNFSAMVDLPFRPVPQPGVRVHGRKSYIERLPTELQLQIVTHLIKKKNLFETNSRKTQNTLRNLMLSCRIFCAIVREPLYRFNANLVRETQHLWNDESCLSWAAWHGCQETVEMAIQITPEMCKLAHVDTAIWRKNYKIAWTLLKQEKIQTDLRAGMQTHSPIFAAVVAGLTEMIDYIISLHGLDVSCRDRDGFSVLDHACKISRWDLVRRFLCENADVWSKPNEKENSPIVLAIHCADPETRSTIVSEMLDLKHERIHESFEDFIHDISRYDRLDVLEIFLEKGVFNSFFPGPERDSEENWNIIFPTAVEYLALAIFRKFLQVFVFTEYTTKIVLFVLDTLCDCDHLRAGGEGMQRSVEMAEMFVEHILLHNYDLSFLNYNSLEGAIAKAVKRDNVLLVDFILGLSGRLRVGQMPGYNLNNGNSKKRKLGPRSADMLYVLVKHGFDVNQLCNNLTTLQLALSGLMNEHITKKKEDMVGVIKALASMVEDINQLNPAGQTALSYWAQIYPPLSRSSHDPVKQVAAIFLDSGADFSIPDGRGNTPLHVLASTKGASVMVKLYLEGGADPNAKNHKGQAPLHAISGCMYFNQSYEKSRLLLESGADPESICNRGVMALHPTCGLWEYPKCLEQMMDLYISTTQKSGAPANVREFLNRECSQGSLLLVDCAFETMNKWFREGPLSHCTLAQRTADFELLLEHGADINRFDRFGRCPLSVVIKFRRKRHTYRPGLWMGNIDRRSQVGWGPHYLRASLSEAVRPMVEYLLKKGAKINAMNKHGRTILDQLDALISKLEPESRYLEEMFERRRFLEERGAKWGYQFRKSLVPNETRLAEYKLTEYKKKSNTTRNTN